MTTISSKLVKSARKDLSDLHFRKLVFHRCYHYPEDVVVTTKGKHLDDKLERLIDTNDLLSVSFLEEGVKVSKSIGRISTSNSWGTGFLIGPNILMTNNHVLKNAQIAKNSFVEFNYELGVDNLPKTTESFVLDPDSIFITYPGLDFTIVGVIGNPGEKYGWIPLLRDPFRITRHERVYIIQHPKGRRKEIGIHDNRVTRVLQHLIRYTTDTEPGSSGSPCFNQDWELVGLHHSAGQQKPDGTFVDNESIKISSIIKYLEGLVESKNNEAYDVLKFAKGEDPSEGFFGKWGISKETKWESVVTDYRGTAKYLDVGFWNIEHFNDSSPPHRILRVTDVISRLNLDVLGLVEVSKEPIKSVTKELQKLDKNFDYLFKDVRGSQDLAIIYNTDTVEVTEEEWSPEAIKAFNSKIRNKVLFWRHPMKVHIKSKVGSGVPFDFKLIVIHAKATTHFDDPEVPPIVRAASAKVLADAIEKEIQDSINSGTPESDYVIGGDFNATLGEGSFDILFDKLNMIALTEDDDSSDNPDAYTYLKRGFRSIIDHVYISSSANVHYDPGSISITRIDKEMAQFTKNISDHAPIAMRLTWSKTPVEIDVSEDIKTHHVEIPGDVDKISIKLNKI